MNHDLLQLLGAVLVLSGFAASQLGWWSAKSVPYLAVNIVGGALLAWLAWTGRDWGFLLLESVWTAVSAAALVHLMCAGRTRTDRPGTSTVR